MSASKDFTDFLVPAGGKAGGSSAAPAAIVTVGTVTKGYVQVQ